LLPVEFRAGTSPTQAANRRPLAPCFSPPAAVTRTLVDCRGRLGVGSSKSIGERLAQAFAIYPDRAIGRRLWCWAGNPIAHQQTREHQSMSGVVRRYT
jgi:hypothetical protein